MLQPQDLETMSSQEMREVCLALLYPWEVSLWRRGHLHLSSGDLRHAFLAGLDALIAYRAEEERAGRRQARGS